MVKKTSKMSCKQGKIGIKIFMSIVTSLVDIVIHVSIYLKKNVSCDGLFMGE